MLADVAAARAEGADGVVIGALLPDGRIDEARTRALIAAAGPLAITFHRAFDMTPDPVAALETLIGLGLDRVLTSGQEATALEGLPLIADLVRRAGTRIIVMPGGGITERNIARIVEGSRPEEIHVGALRAIDGPSTLRREHVFMGGELRAPRIRSARNIAGAARCPAGRRARLRKTALAARPPLVQVMRRGPECHRFVRRSRRRDDQALQGGQPHVPGGSRPAGSSTWQARSRTRAKASIEEQTREVLGKIDALLKDAGTERGEAPRRQRLPAEHRGFRRDEFGL